jgi:hypothetical protein
MRGSKVFLRGDLCGINNALNAAIGFLRIVQQFNDVLVGGKGTEPELCERHAREFCTKERIEFNPKPLPLGN